MSRLTGALAAFAVGSIVFHASQSPPQPPFWTLVLAGSLLGLCRRRWLILGAVCAGLGWSAMHVERSLDLRLDGAMETTVSGRVADLPRLNADHVSFRLRVAEGPGAIRSLRLRWYGGAERPSPGESWRLDVRLRPPTGRLNPAGFDRERWLAAERVDAVGTVTAGERIGGAAPSVAGVRDALSARLRGAVNASQPAAMLAALAVGDRRFLSDATWDRLVDTGTNHLVAISGLHVGLVAGFAGLLVTAAWRLTAWPARYVPAPVAGAAAGIVAAAAYAALAGFTIPTQRALLMLTVVVLALLRRSRVAALPTLVLAMTGVLLLDPLAPLDPGFWMSFLAVAVIAALLLGRPRAGGWRDWPLLQLRLAVVLTPATLWLFGTPVPVAPIANMVAIPLIGLYAVPGTLLALVLTPLGTGAGAVVADWTAWVLWLSLQYLDAVAAAAMVPAFPVPRDPGSWLLLAAAAGLAIVPTGPGGRWLAVPALAAALAGGMPGPPSGSARVTVFDVGYGHASLIATADGVTVIDTGPSGRVLAAYLDQYRPGNIDNLVLTRDRAGYRGGTEALPPAVRRFDTQSGSACGSPKRWQSGGVQFRFLDDALGVDACALLVRAADQRILFATGIEPGDAPRWQRAPAVDVVVLPAGGHEDAVTRPLVRALSPRLAIAPVDRDNRYDLPHEAAVRRLCAGGAAVVTTGAVGAIDLTFGESVTVRTARAAGGWWNVRPANAGFCRQAVAHGGVLALPAER